MKMGEYIIVGLLAMQATVQPLGAGVDSLKSKLDSLIASRAEYELRMRMVQKKIDSLGTVIDGREARRAGVSIESTARMSTGLLAEANGASEKISEIPHGTKMVVTGAQGSYFRVVCQGRTGYVIYWDMNLNDELRKLINVSKREYDSDEQKEIRRKAEEKRVAKRDSERTAEEERQRQLELTARWIKTGSANVRNGPGEKSKIIGHIVMGEKVYVEETKGNWATVVMAEGSSLERTEIEEGTKDWVNTSVLSKEPVSPPSEADIRRGKYCRAHPETSGAFRQAILKGQIAIGMTTDMLIASWGFPEDINRTVMAGLVSEQWVYGKGVYVYLDNGVVTSWQD